MYWVVAAPKLHVSTTNSATSVSIFCPVLWLVNHHIDY